MQQNSVIPFYSYVSRLDRSDPRLSCGCVALWLHEIKYTVDFRLCCVCSLLLHQFHAKLVESSFTTLGIIFQTAKDCNILCYCVQVQSISVLTASLRQPLGSQTGHRCSNPSSLTDSTIPTIYISNNTNGFTPVSYNIHCYSS